MLVNIGTVGAFYIETDHILSIRDYDGRSGCFIRMTGGSKDVSSSQSAQAIFRKIEEAKGKPAAPR